MPENIQELSFLLWIFVGISILCFIAAHLSYRRMERREQNPLYLDGHIIGMTFHRGGENTLPYYTVYVDYVVNEKKYSADFELYPDVAAHYQIDGEIPLLCEANHPENAEFAEDGFSSSGGKWLVGGIFALLPLIIYLFVLLDNAS